VYFVLLLLISTAQWKDGIGWRIFWQECCTETNVKFNSRINLQCKLWTVVLFWKYLMYHLDNIADYDPM